MGTPKLKSKKRDIVNLVTELMNEYEDQIGAPHLTVSFNLSMAESLLAMQFDMVHCDSLQTGLISTKKHPSSSTIRSTC